MSLFQAQDVQMQVKSSSDVVGAAKNCQPFHGTTVPFKVLYCRIKNALSVVFVFIYYLCKSIIKVLQYSIM